ncbi:MAG: hypothetical protein QMB51_01215 [Patescibacteria group bacterium]
MENNNKNSIITELFNSKPFIIIIISTASLILLLLAFKLGVFVGFEKAKFSCMWNNNYNKNFDGPRGQKNGFQPPFSMNGEGLPMMDSRGLFGEVIKIDNNSLTIKDKDDVEKIVVITDKTTIREFKKDIKITDLKIDEKVVIVGEPNSSGQIEARLIRVLPEPKNSNSDVINK